MGHAVAQLVEALRYKPEDQWIFFFNWHNPSGRTLALGSTQPLTEMSKGKVTPLQARLWPGGGRGMDLLFQDLSARRGVSGQQHARPHFTPGKDPLPIAQEAGWVPGPVWTDRKSRPAGIRSPYRPARSQSMYRLSYPAHNRNEYQKYFLGVKAAGV